MLSFFCHPGGYTFRKIRLRIESINVPGFPHWGQDTEVIRTGQADDECEKTVLGQDKSLLISQLRKLLYVGYRREFYMKWLDREGSTVLP